MTTPETRFVYVTCIRSTPDRVFDAITTPEMTRQYRGHDTLSDDWQPGSGWSHVCTDAERSVNLLGKGIENDGPRRLVLSLANASQADDPAAWSRVTFEVEAHDDRGRLTVLHAGLEPGSGMNTVIRRGWPLVVSSLRSFLETEAGMDVFARLKVA